jgi:hypothetical protein
MIIKLDYLFPYYYYAPDRNKFDGMYEWLEHYGGKRIRGDDGFVEISEEDYIILKLKFCL